MLSLLNWGGSYNTGTASPNVLAQRYNVIVVCVDYLQSGAQASIHDPEPYDSGYLQAIDALRAVHFVISELNAKDIKSRVSCRRTGRSAIQFSDQNP